LAVRVRTAMIDGAIVAPPEGWRLTPND